MPKFDYQEKDKGDAGEIIERFFPISENPPAEITESGITYKRIYQVPAIHYFGDGFNTTGSADSITKWQREHMRRD